MRPRPSRLSVELVHHRLVSELGDRLRHLLLDLLLVEGSRHRRLVVGLGGLVLVDERSIVEDDDFQLSHQCSNLPRVRKFIASVVASTLSHGEQNHLLADKACQRVLKPSGTIWVSGTHHVIFSIGFAAFWLLAAGLFALASRRPA